MLGCRLILMKDLKLITQEKVHIYKFRPWKRFYLEETATKAEALNKEKYYKSG